MANLAHLAISLLIVSALQLSSSITFNFPTSETINNIFLEGDATSNGVDLQITSDVAKESWQLSTGRASYAYPMDLWNAKHNTLADFTTRFSFKINGTLQSGDGISFFLVPFDSKIPPNSSGGYLGLFSKGSGFARTTNQVVAVVFDTFQNEWDPSGHRVCININSIASEKQAVWKGTFTDGKIVHAWITYNSTTHNLCVFATYENSLLLGGTSSVCHVIDLREVLPETVRVGFSASTGMYFQTHTILSWELHSSLTIFKSNIIVSVLPSPTVSPWRGVHIVWLVGALIGGLCFVLGSGPSYYFELYHCLGPCLFRRRKMPMEMGSEVDTSENKPVQMGDEDDILRKISIQMVEEVHISENMPIQMVEEDDLSESMPIQIVEEEDILEDMPVEMVREVDLLEDMPNEMGDEEDLLEDMSMVEEEDTLEDMPNEMGDEEDIVNMSMDQEFSIGTGPKSFTFDELSKATDNFSEERKLGQGGFGGVYKGLLAPSDKVIAVKRIAENSAQGVKEYKAEVFIISQLRHKNLVKLVGWCHEKRERLLVYEYMPNGSLDFHLFGRRDPLSWVIRYKVALGLASALRYLHEDWEHCVLHRDIKSSNVMLDSGFNVKLGDFGLARIGSQTTVMGGTIGYLAPECFTTGKSSKESDVYSLGVVALEIACGRRTIHPKECPSKVSLVAWIHGLHGEDKLLDAADVKLNMEFEVDQIKCLMIVGLRCCHPDPTKRPSISQAMNDLINFQATAATKDSFTSYMRRLLFKRRKMPMLMVQEEAITGPDGFTFEQGTGPKSFTFAELSRATYNFSEELKLGEGRYWRFYKGTLTPSNTEIEVGRRSEELNQGKKEYVSEIRIISRLRHRNLIQLIGWCHKKGKLLLVYEYMANGSLNSHLFGHKDPLSWVIRFKISLGLASALLYLHEKCVVHRDVNSSNVMLDSEFNAKLRGFGLGRFVDHDENPQMTQLLGTMGYLAPECLITGELSKESDVYSFGVVALEIACGRKAIEPREEDGIVMLVDFVWDLCGKGELLEAVDAGLNMEFDEAQMECLMIVGLWCCHPDFTRRPTIRQVINVLTFEAPFPNLPSEKPPATDFY